MAQDLKWQEIRNAADGMPNDYRGETRFQLVDEKGRQIGARYFIRVTSQADINAAKASYERAMAEYPNADHGWKNLKAQAERYQTHPFEVRVHATRQGVSFGASHGSKRFAEFKDAVAEIRRAVAAMEARYAKKAGVRAVDAPAPAAAPCPHASVCDGGYGRKRCTRCDAIVAPAPAEETEEEMMAGFERQARTFND